MLTLKSFSTKEYLVAKELFQVVNMLRYLTEYRRNAVAYLLPSLQ